MRARELSGRHVGKTLTRTLGGFSGRTEALTITGIRHRLATVEVDTITIHGNTAEYVFHASEEIGEVRD